MSQHPPAPDATVRFRGDAPDGRKVKGTIFLTTDMHANLYGEVRLRTLEGRAPVGTGIHEVIAGPHGVEIG